MPVWRNARQRRLYGKPDDPIEAAPSSSGSLTRGSQTPGASTEDRTRKAEPTPPPAPKRVKREKTRPESEYELIHGFPVTESEPDYSLLTNPVDPKQIGSVIAYAIHASRQNWLSGPMLETFWTRKPKGKKTASEGQINLREKMTKLHECSVTLGPHTFPVKLFMVRDDNVHIDEEADKKVEEILDAEKKKREELEQAKIKAEQEAHPVEGAKPSEGEKAAEGTKPSEDGKAAEENKPLEGDKSTEAEKPVERTKPVESEKSSEGTEEMKGGKSEEASNSLKGENPTELKKPDEGEHRTDDDKSVQPNSSSGIVEPVKSVEPSVDKSADMQKHEAIKPEEGQSQVTDVNPKENAAKRKSLDGENEPRKAVNLTSAGTNSSDVRKNENNTVNPDEDETSQTKNKPIDGISTEQKQNPEQETESKPSASTIEQQKQDSTTPSKDSNEASPAVSTDANTESKSEEVKPPPAKKVKRTRKPKKTAASATPPSQVSPGVLPEGASNADKTVFANEKETIEAQKRKNEELEQRSNSGRQQSAEASSVAPGSAASTPALANTSGGTPETTVNGASAVPSQPASVPVNAPMDAPINAPAAPIGTSGVTQQPPHGQTPHPETPLNSAGAPGAPSNAPGSSPATTQASPSAPVASPQSGDQGNGPRPTPMADDAARAPPPNQLVVYRLQQMAARDPSLSNLMRLVASGKASQENISKFQEIINRVKASIANSPFMLQQQQLQEQHIRQPQHQPAPAPKPTPKKQHAAPKPKSQRPTVPYHPRPNAKAIMLAIEFDESPSERYLLPKRSIIEFVPEKEDLLWSFLHVAQPKSSNKSKSCEDVRAIYTPVTAVFHHIPQRIAQTSERCVRKPEVVRYYMKQTMQEAERAKPWNVWFQIEKNDEVLTDLIRKMQAPMMPPPSAPRKPLKPRKPRAPTAHQLQQQHLMEQQQQYHAYMMWLARVKRGQPLPAVQIPSLRRGEPFVQPPGFMFRPTIELPMFARPMMPAVGVQPGTMASGPMAPIAMGPGPMAPPGMIPGGMVPNQNPGIMMPAGPVFPNAPMVGPHTNDNNGMHLPQQPGYTQPIPMQGPVAIPQPGMIMQPMSGQSMPGQLMAAPVASTMPAQTNALPDNALAHPVTGQATAIPQDTPSQPVQPAASENGTDQSVAQSNPVANSSGSPDLAVKQEVTEPKTS